jgi:hypothetical protein
MITNQSARTRKRWGVAAVETAVVTPFLFLIFYGVWEIGRLVQVSQIVTNAAREGGRQAATGTISASSAGTGTAWQVQNAVGNYLHNAGLPFPPEGIKIKIQNTTKNWISNAIIYAPATGSTATTVAIDGGAPTSDPIQSSDQYDQFQIELWYPFKFARWSPANAIFYLADTTTLYGCCKWLCMRDKAITVDNTIPNAPVN